MVSKVVFYNYWHNGDLHASRGLVSKTIQILKEKNICNEFEYYHGRDFYILKDIKDLKQKNAGYSFLEQKVSAAPFIQDDILFINTWYRSGGYINKYGLTFDCLYFLFRDTLLHFLNVELGENNPAYYLPEIDYNSYNISFIKHCCEITAYKKLALICNNDVMSSQSHNFNMVNMSAHLSKKYRDCLFVLTNKVCDSNENMVFFTDIFPSVVGLNLNEISYFANYCKVIIGRASGPFSFCITKDKLFDSRKSFISFSLVGGFHQFWIGNYLVNSLKYPAFAQEYSEFNENKMINIISKEIER
jgi:hypothetical protein